METTSVVVLVEWLMAVVRRRGEEKEEEEEEEEEAEKLFLVLPIRPIWAKGSESCCCSNQALGTAVRHKAHSRSIRRSRTHLHKLADLMKYQSHRLYSFQIVDQHIFRHPFPFFLVVGPR